MDRSFSLPVIPSGGIKELISKFDLCVTGEVTYTFHHQKQEIFSFWKWHRVSVYCDNLFSVSSNVINAGDEEIPKCKPAGKKMCTKNDHFYFFYEHGLLRNSQRNCHLEQAVKASRSQHHSAHPCFRAFFLSQQAFSYLQSSAKLAQFFHSIIQNIQVFARVAPKQKVE